MGSLRFLLSRRWVLFALAVALLATLAWWLGEWQFHRLEDRQERNRTFEANVAAEPVPVGDVLAVGRGVPRAEEWRRVRASGEYDAAGTVVVRYRTRESTSGIDVVVPLVTADGTALLVDRGWMASENRGGSDQALPDPPAGAVTVTGWVRDDATGDSTAVTDDGSTRAISSRAIGDYLGRPVYGGFLELESESPEPAQALTPVELPETGSGPHFFYGLQWWFFGLLALGGFGYLAYDEWRGGRGLSRQTSGRSPAGRAAARRRRAASRR